jgi:uncharacterized membrane protein
MKKAISIISILQLLCGIACIIYGICFWCELVEVNPTTAGLYAIACGIFGIMDAIRK